MPTPTVTVPTEAFVRITELMEYAISYAKRCGDEEARKVFLNAYLGLLWRIPPDAVPASWGYHLDRSKGEQADE